MKRSYWLLAGAAVLALGGAALAAPAQDPLPHEMSIRLPGGGIEHITYSGNLHVSFERTRDPFATAFEPMTPFWPDFAELNRISARMDQEMNAMLARAQAMQAAARSGQLDANFANVPAGSVSYEQITTWTGNGVCTQTVHMSEPANGGQPQYVSNTSGNCGSSAPRSSSNAIQAKAQTAPHAVRDTRI